MKVALVHYPQTWLIEGGHRTQQADTAAALRRAGVDAVIADVEAARRDSFDLVHFFGDPRPLLADGPLQAPLVVSPVHFPAAFTLGPAFRRGGRVATAAERARHRTLCIRHARARRARWADFRAMMAAHARADLIVTNSRAEAELVRRDAVSPLPPVRVAYSGVDRAYFDGSPDEGRRILGLGDEPFVLCAARVEPRKNQLSLALALRGLGVRLVLAGAVLPGNEPYMTACRAACPDLVHVSHLDRPSLAHAYAAAAVHALPSWFETTGLSTLEALAAGTPAVAGRGPCVDEYFAGHAYLHDPADITELRAAVERALMEPRGRGRALAERLSWDRTAEELVAAYAAVVSPAERVAS